MTNRYAIPADRGRKFCAFNIYIHIQRGIYKIEREKDEGVYVIGPDRNNTGFAFDDGMGMPLTRIPLGVVIDEQSNFGFYSGGIVDYAENEEAVISIAKEYIEKQRNNIISETYRLLGVAITIGPATILDL